MISWKRYHRATEAEWRGVRVKLDKKVDTGIGLSWPADTEGTIVSKFRGFEVLGDPCKHCGVQMRLFKCDPEILSIVAPEKVAPRVAALTPLEALRQAKRRDDEKGGDGFRTTREVAEACDLSMDHARKLLWKLVDSEEIEAADAGTSGRKGNPVIWRVKTEKKK